MASGYRPNYTREFSAYLNAVRAQRNIPAAASAWPLLPARWKEWAEPAAWNRPKALGAVFGWNSRRSTRLRGTKTHERTRPHSCLIGRFRPAPPAESLRSLQPESYSTRRREDAFAI